MKPLKDFKSGNTTTLKSFDNRIRIVDFDNPLNTEVVVYTSWRDQPTPTSTATRDWNSEASNLAYQALYISDLVVSQFDNLGIGSFFSDVWIGTQEVYDNALALNWLDNLTPQAILIGGDSYGDPLALPDLIGHELTHIYLRQFLKFGKKGASSLIEGLADIFGTFIESKIQGYEDWRICDDEPGAQSAFNRDLSNPGSNADCFTKVLDEKSSHKRGQPLGFWYYLISTGKTSPIIPSLGLDKAMEIVMASLKNLDNNSDYKDIMKATMSYVLEKYGRCSNEFRSVAQAWEFICVPTGYGDQNGDVPACGMSICMNNNIICEETDQIYLCACGQYPNNAIFNWTIIGPKSTEFNAYGGITGNAPHTTQNCLQITDIPKYSYYPQYLKIRAFSGNTCETDHPRPDQIDHLN
ncbi:MAG: M4 family metallopeptidase, partial [Saprospiraceae bacterium]